MTELVRYEAACRAISEAANIDEVKEFRDQSEAMRAYARQAKNKKLEVQAAEIRIRAERRIGELMAAQRDSVGLSAGGRPSEKTGSQTDPVSAPPTLSEVGIDKHLADRARKYAAIPEQEFNGIVSDWRDKVNAENQRVTVNLLSAGEKAQATKPAEPKPVDPDAKLRAEYRAMTPEAQEDDWIGLRHEISDLRKRVQKQTGIIADQKQAIHQLSEGSDIGKALSAKMKELGAVKLSRDEALAAVKREEYKRKKAEKELAAITGQEIKFA